MKRFQIAAVSLNTTPLDLEGNISLHERVLESSEILESSIVLFPELSITGYGCEDAFYRPYLWEDSLKYLERLFPYSKNKIIAVGLPYFFSPYLYNAVAIIFEGQIIAIVPKRNLPNTGVHYEKRWFTEWMGGSIQVNSIQFGDVLLDWNGLKIFIEICEDSWVINRPSNKYSEIGADVILSPGASHFAFYKDEVRSRIFIEASRVQENVFVFSNLMGNESGRIIFDGGNLIISNGKIYAKGIRLIPGDYHIVKANLDLDEIRQSRVKNLQRSNHVDNNESSKRLTCIILNLPGYPFNTNLIPSIPISINSEENIYSSFTSAQILGLFDYLRKSGMKGFTLSLSGGVDSSVLAILVSTMEKEISNLFGEDFWVHNGYTRPLLTTLYQQTKNNSITSKMIAKSLSKELKSNHYEINIDENVESMTTKISLLLGKELNWKDDNLALQNIQARVRSPLVWLLANVNNHLLLSTGNRSESSVGYTTMDGDSSGSLSPIAGVSKSFLLNWLLFISNGEEHRIPVFNTLSSLLEFKPTAELKPPEENQEDEKDLMPYSILQKIEFYAIHQGKSKEDILNRLSFDHDNYSYSELQSMVEKFLSLFNSSQWKRERIPPSFHLDEYGLDSRSSYRFPILSGTNKN